MNNLKFLRMRAGWTQAGLAKRLGFDQGILSHIESGLYSRAIAAMEKEFGVPLEVMLAPVELQK